jgi:hypothetical protein
VQQIESLFKNVVAYYNARVVIVNFEFVGLAAGMVWTGLRTVDLLVLINFFRHCSAKPQRLAIISTNRQNNCPTTFQPGPAFYSERGVDVMITIFGYFRNFPQKWPFSQKNNVLINFLQNLA